MSADPYLSDIAEHYIGGSWMKGGAVADSANPATDEVLGSYYDADLETAQSAISAARSAFDGQSWGKDRDIRAKVLWQLADAVEAHHDELVTALTLENGKLRHEAEFEFSLTAPKLRYYAGLTLTDSGSASETRPGVVSMLLKEPVGVAGIIVPWNAPVILAIRSLAPALAAGCTAVVKMPAQTALTNNLLARVLAEATELPAGVVNIFTESGDAGARELVSSAQVDVISYTGSSAVGALIMAAAAPQLKRVSLELGGKTPMIVFNDADLDVVVPTLTAALSTSAGQICFTGSRILAETGIAAELRSRLAASFEQLKPGPASDPSSQIGPMISHDSVARVDAIIEGAEGAEVIVRGGLVDGPGSFYRPALLGVSDLNSPLIQNEIFGPVAIFETFGSEEEAADRANATGYGLAASIWTADGGRSLRMSAAVQAGTVWTNTWGQLPDQYEDGGYKKSGLGRLSGLGGLAEFQEVKHVLRMS
ncbi:aldehyde dehydrogenase family protein [Nocardia jiangxiensis]|uniref:Aldehyde dehydrogenase family protein n=1 Tax=Nocardia jiangxiensis TaxID=282685 RepID=A0ABW6S954_9NOCA